MAFRTKCAVDYVQRHLKKQIGAFFPFDFMRYFKSVNENQPEYGQEVIIIC